MYYVLPDLKREYFIIQGRFNGKTYYWNKLYEVFSKCVNQTDITRKDDTMKSLYNERALNTYLRDTTISKESKTALLTILDSAVKSIQYAESGATRYNPIPITPEYFYSEDFNILASVAHLTDNIIAKIRREVEASWNH